MSLVPANVDQGKVLQALGLNINDPKAQATLLICDRYDLDPFLGHMQLVQNKPYITRDGYLHIAHSSGKFDGLEVLEEWKSESGALCVKVAAYRKDMSRPFTAVGRVKPGEKTMADPWDQALTRAERRALRRAFDVAGVVDADVDELEHGEPLPAGEEPFDVASSEQPALPAATSAKAAAEKRSIIEQGAAMKDKDPISEQEKEALVARIKGFDAEHQAMAGEQMKTYGLSLKRDRVSRLEARSIVQVLDSVEALQADAWEQRRKAVAAEFGVVFPEGLGDEERHTRTLEATKHLGADDGGPTESMKRLTEAQATAVLDYLGSFEPTQQQLGEAS